MTNNSNQSITHYDIIICGGGMVGGSLACLLAQKKRYRIAIIDKNNGIETPKKSKEKTFSNRVSAITLASEKLLKEINVWQHMTHKAPYKATKVWHDNHINTPSSLSFNTNQDDATNPLDENTTHLGHVIENNTILEVINKQLISSDVDYITASLVDINSTKLGYSIVLDNKQKLDTKLLIGADGANSLVASLAHINNERFNYKQQGIVGVLKTTQNFNECIYQWFGNKNIIAILPLSTNTCSLVWSCDNRTAESLCALSDEDFVKVLSKETHYYFGDLTLVNTIQSFKLQKKHAQHYVKPHLALVGDAAHTIHPLAGQGLNLGFADVVALANTLEQTHEKGKTLGNYRYLKRYEQNRKPQNTLMSATMSGFYELSNNKALSILSPIINHGINWLDTQENIKTILQNKASGLS